jgi:hypothetical protein
MEGTPAEQAAIDALLELDGVVIEQRLGCWVKIAAWRVETSPDIPHGVRYSLTLHGPYNKRIIGYDNSHAVKPPRKLKFAGRRLPYDHRHRHVADKGVPYTFTDAYQLLSDFFAEVDRALQEIEKQWKR